MYHGRSATIRCFAEGLLAGFQQFPGRKQHHAISMAQNVAATVTFAVNLRGRVLLGISRTRHSVMVRLPL